MKSNKMNYQANVMGNIDVHLSNMRKTEGQTCSYATEAEIVAISDMLGCQI